MWLSKLEESISNLVNVLTEFEERYIGDLRESAKAHRHRAGIPAPRRGKTEVAIFSEEAFSRKVKQAKSAHDKILAKQKEVRSQRDAMLNASAVLESRAAVSQAETVYILTILMIMYLPVQTVVAVFSMEMIPKGTKQMHLFLITLFVVLAATSALGVNMGSIMWLIVKAIDWLGERVEKSMGSVGGAWTEKSRLIREINEADKLVNAREQRRPVTLWYSWYVSVYALMIFPAVEIRQAGGIVKLVKIIAQSKPEFPSKSASPGIRGDYVRITQDIKKKQAERELNWGWDIAAVPFRVAFLPLHLVILILDYLVLVVFGGLIIGYARKHCEPEQAAKQSWKARWLKKKTPETDKVQGSSTTGLALPDLEKKDPPFSKQEEQKHAIATTGNVQDEQEDPKPKHRTFLQWLQDRFIRPAGTLKRFSAHTRARPEGNLNDMISKNEQLMEVSDEEISKEDSELFEAFKETFVFAEEYARFPSGGDGNNNDDDEDDASDEDDANSDGDVTAVGKTWSNSGTGEMATPSASATLSHPLETIKPVQRVHTIPFMSQPSLVAQNMRPVRRVPVPVSSSLSPYSPLAATSPGASPVPYSPLAHSTPTTDDPPVYAQEGRSQSPTRYPGPHFVTQAGAASNKPQRPSPLSRVEDTYRRNSTPLMGVRRRTSDEKDLEKGVDADMVKR